jgi:putative acetyltransferase
VTDFPTLTIRGLRTDDWTSLYALFCNEAVLLQTYDLPYVGEESFRERVNNPPANMHTLVAELMLPSGRERLVGVAWLKVMERRQRHVGRLILAIQPELRGGEIDAGLLQAALALADDWLALRRVETVVFPPDDAHVALLQQHGFVHEATMRRYIVRAGQYADGWLLARLHPVTVAGEQGGVA